MGGRKHQILTQPNPKGLKVQTFPLQKMGYPSPEEAPPNPGLPYPILNLPEKFKSWLFAGQVYICIYKPTPLNHVFDGCQHVLQVLLHSATQAVGVPI